MHNKAVKKASIPGVLGQDSKKLWLVKSKSKKAFFNKDCS